ncbi:hypothetical protein VZT92_000374 [Zoarces viviparus]
MKVFCTLESSKAPHHSNRRPTTPEILPPEQVRHFNSYPVASASVPLGTWAVVKWKQDEPEANRQSVSEGGVYAVSNS